MAYNPKYLGQIIQYNKDIDSSAEYKKIWESLNKGKSYDTYISKDGVNLPNAPYSDLLQMELIPKTDAVTGQDYMLDKKTGVKYPIGGYVCGKKSIADNGINIKFTNAITPVGNWSFCFKTYISNNNTGAYTYNFVYSYGTTTFAIVLSQDTYGVTIMKNGVYQGKIGEKIKQGEVFDLIITYNSATNQASGYKNGISLNTITITNGISAIFDGFLNGYGGTFNPGGNFSDFRIYNRALSPTEALAYHNNQTITPSGNLLLHYPICEGSGITIYDISGNNNHGTLYYGTAIATQAQAEAFWMGRQSQYNPFKLGYGLYKKGVTDPATGLPRFSTWTGWSGAHIGTDVGGYVGDGWFIASHGVSLGSGNRNAGKISINNNIVTFDGSGVSYQAFNKIVNLPNFTNSISISFRIKLKILLASATVNNNIIDFQGLDDSGNVVNTVDSDVTGTFSGRYFYTAYKQWEVQRTAEAIGSEYVLFCAFNLTNTNVKKLVIGFGHMLTTPTSFIATFNQNDFIIETSYLPALNSTTDVLGNTLTHTPSPGKLLVQPAQIDFSPNNFVGRDLLPYRFSKTFKYPNDTGVTTTTTNVGGWVCAFGTLTTLNNKLVYKTSVTPLVTNHDYQGLQGTFAATGIIPLPNKFVLFSVDVYATGEFVGEVLDWYNQVPANKILSNGGVAMTVRGDVQRYIAVLQLTGTLSNTYFGKKTTKTGTLVFDNFMCRELNYDINTDIDIVAADMQNWLTGINSFMNKNNLTYWDEALKEYDPYYDPSDMYKWDLRELADGYMDMYAKYPETGDGQVSPIIGLDDTRANMLTSATSYLDEVGAYIKRAKDDSGTEFGSYAIINDYLKYLRSNSLYDSTKFLWNANFPLKSVAGVEPKNVSKVYSLNSLSTDAAQITTANQPYLRLALNSNDKNALVAPHIATQSFSSLAHSTITFQHQDTWSLCMVLSIDGKKFASSGGEIQFTWVNDAGLYAIGGSFSGGRINFYAASADGHGVISHNITYNWQAIVGKIKVMHFVYNTSTVSLYVDGVYIGQVSVSGDFMWKFQEFIKGYQPDWSFHGKIYHHQIFSKELSQAEITTQYYKFAEYYPALLNGGINSVTIGTQTWAVRNCDMSVTPQGNVITNVTWNNADKAVNGTFNTNVSGGWSTVGNSLSWVDDTGGQGHAMVTKDASFGDVLIMGTFQTTNRYYKITFRAKAPVVTNQPQIIVAHYADIYLETRPNLTASWQNYVFYAKATSTAFVLYLAQSVAGGSVVEIDDIVIQELGWNGMQTVYDYIYASTVGNAATKTSAAIKAAAAWRYYDNLPANGVIYGKLYNWWAAKLLNDDMVVTTGYGWKVPTGADFYTLFVTSLGGYAVAGGKAKHAGLTYWGSPNAGANNESGFTALPGGYASESGEFFSINQYSIYVASDEYSSTKVNLYYMSKDSRNQYYLNVVDKIRGCSIRLIKA